jgi:hypothetical protein
VPALPHVRGGEQRKAPAERLGVLEARAERGELVRPARELRIEDELGAQARDEKAAARGSRVGIGVSPQRAFQVCA